MKLNIKNLKGKTRPEAFGMTEQQGKELMMIAGHITLKSVKEGIPEVVLMERIAGACNSLEEFIVMSEAVENTMDILGPGYLMYTATPDGKDVSKGQYLDRLIDRMEKEIIKATYVK